MAAGALQLQRLQQEHEAALANASLARQEASAAAAAQEEVGG